MYICRWVPIQQTKPRIDSFIPTVFNSVSVIHLLWRGQHLVQRKRMETWKTECLLVMWGMSKVCENVLRRHHLNFVLKVAVIEAATNQRELVIWVPFGLVRGELLESLRDKERFGWCPESNSECLSGYR